MATPVVLVTGAPGPDLQCESSSRLVAYFEAGKE